jgi:hypothetical protein
LEERDLGLEVINDTELENVICVLPDTVTERLAGVNASTDGIAIDRKAAKAVCESFMIMF